MTDTIYNKRDPRRLYYGFRVKLIIFKALTNCFRKNLMDFLRFASIYTFCSVPNQRSSKLLEGMKEPRLFSVVI